MRASVMRYIAFTAISALATSWTTAAIGQGFEHGMEVASELSDRSFADPTADRDDNSPDDLAARVGEEDRAAGSPGEHAFGQEFRETADVRQTAADNVAESAVATAPDAGATWPQEAGQIARRRLLVSDGLLSPNGARDCWEYPPAKPDVGVPNNSWDYECDPE